MSLTNYIRYANSKYSNRSYTDKKTMENGFDASSLSVNLPLHSVDHWDEQAMLDRRAWWQRKLESSWPEPTTDYKPVEVDTKVSLLDDHDLTGTSVRILHMQGDTIPVSTWSETLDVVVERMFELDPDFYEKVVDDELAARFIRADKDALRGPEQISDTDYYVEMHTNTATKKQLMERLSRMMGWERDELMVELAEPLASQ